MDTIAVEATGRDRPSPAGTVGSSIRSMQPADEVEIRRIFRQTLARGSAATVDLGDLRAYEDLCLDWYLRFGEVLVVVADGRVTGYLLACLDERRHRAWQRRHALRWATTSLLQVATGRRRSDARRFVLLRLRDGIGAWRDAAPPAADAHAHVNLEPQLRAGRVGPSLARRMDALALTAGHTAWYGEMNRPAARSHRTLERRGVHLVDRRSSATFSWLAGEPIERLTLVRQVRPRRTTAVA